MNHMCDLKNRNIIVYIMQILKNQKEQISMNLKHSLK